MKMVALIPARAGSKRIPGKNTKELAGRPLIEYTLAAAYESGVFDGIIVATDSRDLMQWCYDNHVATYVRAITRDNEPDIEWIRGALTHSFALRKEAFSILRPTSPFRTAETIRRAYAQFVTVPDVQSLRAVQPAKEHPGKQWTWQGPGYPMKPVLDVKHPDGTPWHSSPTQTLITTYVQNACLEMAWTYVVDSFGTISGKKIAPFFTHGYEGFDLNTMDDWHEAERLIKEGLVALPSRPLARV